MDIHDHIWERLSTPEPFILELWQPRDLAVVVGYSQKTTMEVYLGNCRRDGVPVIRRRGGGGAVVLMPGVVCLTCAFTSARSDSPYFFFKEINNWIVAVLADRCGVQNLSLRGISDIALNDRKILGCAMWKSRRSFLYQGSLLVDPALALMDRYLLHPSREPDYRQGRGHGEFVTSLAREGYSFTPAQLIRLFAAEQSALRTQLLTSL